MAEQASILVRTGEAAMGLVPKNERIHERWWNSRWIAF